MHEWIHEWIDVNHYPQPERASTMNRGDRSAGGSGRNLCHEAPTLAIFSLACRHPHFHAAATMLSTAAAAAPTFDCRTSKHPNEKLICQSTELSKLDNQMSHLFRDIIKYLDDNHQRGLQTTLEQDQAQWRKQRLDCGNDFPCTKNVPKNTLNSLVQCC
jgi:uncharacterized protein YecT (DUF1311 family)